MRRIAIIGGGAAGLAAAVSAGQEADSRGTPTQITVFEASDRVGKSLLASGNGRCNFSNSRVKASAYYNSDFVREALASLPPEEAFNFLSNQGLLWHEEGDGRLYPVTNKASSVLDVFRFAADQVKVKIDPNCMVHSITPVKGQFLVAFADERTAFFDAIIVACGGKVARSILPPGYVYHNTQPMLGPLKTNTEMIRGLGGVRARCVVRSGEFCEEGEVQFRDYGVSGIVIFNLSRFVKAGDSLTLDFLPSVSCADMEKFMAGRFDKLKGRTAIEFCAGLLQAPLARAVLRVANIRAESVLAEEDIPSLGEALKAFPLSVLGIEDYRQCQVNRGGFAVEDFNPRTCESQTDRGLFVVGEALDVDGPCGGYNLHWAWTSGILAGRSAVHTKVLN